MCVFFNLCLCRLLFYEIKDNSIFVKCIIVGFRIMLRCKIWLFFKNFGLNKVEVLLNDVFFWKKGFWFYNVKSICEFIVGDDIKVIVEWYVVLRIGYYNLFVNDLRRS